MSPLSRASGDVGGVVSAEATGSEDMVACDIQADRLNLVAEDIWEQKPYFLIEIEVYEGRKHEIQLLKSGMETGTQHEARWHLCHHFRPTTRESVKDTRSDLGSIEVA